ncbi:MAG: histidine ammonia-lyase [Candidatus Marinimicrobia bacterium]|nr:histidine ammonia-lyase [Candidatus Neomarinimicrobiota bacterium]MDP6936163.1 histidine ammonia-lyase [Candidatus Neomarinimicrobiota bacterium]
MANFIVEDKKYTLEEIYSLSESGLRLRLSPAVTHKIQSSRRVLESVLESGKTVYGVNTGFGKLSQVKISDSQITQLQQNLLLSHAAGVGNPVESSLVRLMMVLKVLSLSKGYSGIRTELVEKLTELINHGLIPLVPEKGSVGASGDLAPLSHMSLPLIGEGKIKVDSGYITSVTALKKEGISPLTLSFKEGLALINGTQFSTAYGVIYLCKLHRLTKIADIAGALSVEGILGTDTAFLEKVQSLKHHPGQAESAANLYQLLQDSEIHRSHEDCERVQDMYSIRCMPQVHGASRDTLRAASKIIENEVNAVSDNPLIFPDGEVISAGNFHAEHAAQAMDMAAIAAAELGNISERRIYTLTKGEFDLPPFLISNPGVNSGVMMSQVTAAALASENKGLAHPASVDSIPTGADQEDHVSMAPWAGRKLKAIVENLESILAIEILCACQAITLRGGLQPAKRLIPIMNIVREVVPELLEDRIQSEDISLILTLIQSGKLLATIEKESKLQ